jgi:hypothetical protein
MPGDMVCTYDLYELVRNALRSQWHLWYAWFTIMYSQLSGLVSQTRIVCPIAKSNCMLQYW